MGINGQSRAGRPELWLKSPLAFLRKLWNAEEGLATDRKAHFLAQLELWRALVKGLEVGDQEAAAMLADLYRGALEETDLAKKVRAVSIFQRLARSCGFLRAGRPAGRPVREPWKRIPTSGQAPHEDDTDDEQSPTTDGTEEGQEAQEVEA